MGMGGAPPRKRFGGLRRKSKKKKQPKAAEMTWETEAMHAFKGLAGAGEQGKQGEQGDRGAGAPGLAWGKARRHGLPEDEDGWVLVQQAGEPIGLSSGPQNVMVLPPPSLMVRGTGIRNPYAAKKKSSIPVVTREMTDTEYNRVFKRPLPHNYGMANIKPVNDADYMKTFNVKAADADPGQVFDSALAAEETRAESEPLAEDMDFSVAAAAGLTVEGVAIAPSAAAPATSAPSPPSFEGMTFGRASKERASEPSMFEILSWSGSGWPESDAQGAPAPGGLGPAASATSTMDARNFASLPPQSTAVIPPAGADSA